MTFTATTNFTSIGQPVSPVYGKIETITRMYGRVLMVVTGQLLLWTVPSQKVFHGVW